MNMFFYSVRWKSKLKKPELIFCSAIPYRLFLECILWQKRFSTAVLRVMMPTFLYSAMGGQSLCPVSRELLYSTFPAMQEAPISGVEPRKMM